jgi:hypothetical protein
MRKTLSAAAVLANVDILAKDGFYTSAQIAGK